jgi:O-6-methylguanine DNA methyltransferase
MSFSYKVYKIVKEIPKGQIMTYKEVAKFAGNEKAYRAVGNILHKNPNTKLIPCHRVVRSNMTLSENYLLGGKKVQKEKLILEGIKFKKNRIIKN